MQRLPTIADYPCRHRSSHVVREDQDETGCYSVYDCNCDKVKSPLCSLNFHGMAFDEHIAGCSECRFSEVFESNIEDDVTIVCTMFRRPDCLSEFLQSVARTYFDVPIIVVDNGDQPLAWAHSKFHEYRIIPFDSGLAASRNYALTLVETKYVMICEEDFIFTNDTKIEKFVDVLESDETIAIVGGSLWQDNREQRLALDLEEFRGTLYGRAASRPWQETLKGVRYQFCDQVFNFCLARVDALRECPWDARLKVREHVEHSWRLKKLNRWRVAHCPEVRCEHRPVRRADYLPFRQRTGDRDDFTKYVLESHKLTSITLLAAGAQSDRTHDKPNVIVLGIGHSGTTIVTKLIELLGWNACGADEEYRENVAIRDVNEMLIVGEKMDQHHAEAEAALRSLESPWVVKDPRFVHTLDQWMLKLRSHQPLLLWLERDRDAVAASYARRDEGRVLADGQTVVRGLTLEQQEECCAKLYREWPWQKLRITYEEIRAAVEIFDVERAIHISHRIHIDA